MTTLLLARFVLLAAIAGLVAALGAAARKDRA